MIGGDVVRDVFTASDDVIFIYSTSTSSFVASLYDMNTGVLPPISIS